MQPWCRLTDVQYHFVRGQGWVPSTDNTQTIIIERDGKRITATIRMPLEGEKFFYNSPREIYCRQWRGPNDEFLFEKFVNFFVERFFRERHKNHIGCTYRPGVSKTDGLTVVFTVEDE